MPVSWPDFGCGLLGFDVHHSPQFEKLGGRYAEIDEIVVEADIISLHCPLIPQTHHIVDARMLARVKRGALLINTSLGGLVDTEAVIEALKSGQLGGLAIDVYERRPASSSRICQAFFTREALATILETTLRSISDFAAGRPLANEIAVPA